MPFLTRVNLTDDLIEFALNTTFEDIPQNVIDVQKRSLLDSIGVMSAATTLESACLQIMEYAQENSKVGEYPIIGTDRRASTILAAMANGSLIHALDYEDGHDLAKVHPNTASIPAMLALGDRFGKSGKEVLCAMVIASEMACRLKLSVIPNDLRLGWYSPPMYSAYGAVLGAAALVGLNKDQALDALSITSTQIMMPGQSALSARSSLRGIREAFSAKAVILGIELALRGVKARVDKLFEGDIGIFTAIAHGKYNGDSILDELGTRWESEKLRFKEWPCCGTTHGVLDTMFGLIKDNGLKGEEIKSVELIVNPIHTNVLEPHNAKFRPKSLASAKFSLPFSIALAIKYGKVTLDLYRESALTDESLLKIADSVSYTIREVEPDKPASYYNDDHVKVTLNTVRGRFTRESFVSKGGCAKPLTDEEILLKYIDCMRHSEKRYSDQEIRNIYDGVKTFESYANIKDFSSCL